MGSNSNKERALIKSVYNTDSWNRRVDKMSDAQVVAIYMRLKAAGKL